MFAKRCNLCSSFFQPERYNFINFSSCCLSGRKFATVFKTSLSLPYGIYVLTNYFSKSGEGRCPVVPLVFKTSLGIVRSPEGSTPSLLRQETTFNYRVAIVASELWPIGSPKLHSPLHPETRLSQHRFHC